MAELAKYIKLDFEDHVLKLNYHKFLMRALVIAAAVHLGIVGSYWASLRLVKEEPPPTNVVRIKTIRDLGPPPSITGQEAAVAPSVSVAPAVKPSVGIPVPVPDAEVSAEQTFASQQEMSAEVSPIAEIAQGAIGDIQIEEDDVPPPDFVPFEKEPVVIHRVEPVYPEFAKKAGLEGSVYVNIWVDKEGKVRDVKVLKSDSDIFVQPVIDACKQWLFSPAMMKNGPVAVWVAVPFRFSMQNAQ